MRRANATLHWGIDDPHELERVGLTLVSRKTAEDFVASSDMARPPWPTRLLYRLMVKIPPVRNMGQLLHYRF